MIFDKFYFPPNFLPSQTQRNQLEWATPPRGKQSDGQPDPKSLIYIIYTSMKQHAL